MNRRDLVALVRQVQAGSGLSDPRDIAAKVMTLLTDGQVREALEVVLPQFCTQWISQERMKVRNARPDSAHNARPDPKASLPGNATKPGQPNALKPRSVTDHIRDNWHASFLAQDVKIGRAYKKIGDCTAAELLELASRNRDHAASAISVAGRYEQLAAEMTSRKVKVVSKLPAAVVRAVFLGAAE